MLDAPFEVSDECYNIMNRGNNTAPTNNAKIATTLKTAEDTAIENAKEMSSEKKMAVESEERSKLEAQKADYQQKQILLARGCRF